MVEELGGEGMPRVLRRTHAFLQIDCIEPESFLLACRSFIFLCFPLLICACDSDAKGGEERRQRGWKEGFMRIV